MSRSGYSDELDNWELICWRGAVASAIRGKRGQAFLRELADAMDAMPEKRLIAHDLERDGEYCALGVVAAKRGVDVKPLDPFEYDDIAAAMDIPKTLVCEIEYHNDECGGWCGPETPEQRWKRMRRWVASRLKESTNSEA